MGRKGMPQHVWRARSGLDRPAVTAASLISSSAACRVRALDPLRTEWNSQGEGAPLEWVRASVCQRAMAAMARSCKGTSRCLSPLPRTSSMRVPGGAASEGKDRASLMRMPEA